MKAYNVLMIEDDIDDRYITDKYFLDNGYHINVEYLSADEDVLQCLESTDASNMPQLILMSGKHGLELLAKLKAHETFRQVPVVVLTELTHRFTVNEAYRLGASSVIVKPSTHQLTKEKIETFSRYWFSVVELPLAADTSTPLTA